MSTPGKPEDGSNQSWTDEHGRPQAENDAGPPPSPADAESAQAPGWGVAPPPTPPWAATPGPENAAPGASVVPEGGIPAPPPPAWATQPGGTPETPPAVTPPDDSDDEPADRTMIVQRSAQPAGDQTQVVQHQPAQPVGDATQVVQQPVGDATQVVQHQPAQPVGDQTHVVQRPPVGPAPETVVQQSAQPAPETVVQPFSPPPPVAQPWEIPPPGAGAPPSPPAPAPYAQPEATMADQVHRPFSPPPQDMNPWETGPPAQQAAQPLPGPQGLYAPPAPQGPHAPHGAGFQQPGGPPPAEPWLVEGAQRRKRTFPTKLILVVAGGLVVVVGAAAGVYALVASGGDSSDKVPVSQLADDLFAAGQGGSDGLDQSINAVASAQGMAIAVGSETGGLNPRPRFLVSTDNGQNWQVATVTAKDGAPATGNGPDAVFGVPGAWVALASSNSAENVWTSKDGRAWTQLGAAAGVFVAGDKIEQITRSAAGFIAVGHRQQGSKTLPLLWRSADGATWRRVAGGQLRLPTDGGAVGPLRYAVSAGGDALIAGTVVKSKSTVAGLWRSSDGGQTWRPIATPTQKGAFGDLHLAANGSGFLALRKGKEGSQRPGLLFRSANGDNWQAAGQINGSAEPAPLRLAGGDSGFALLSNLPGNRRVLFQSQDGATWGQPVDMGAATNGSAVGLATVGGVTLVGESVRQSDLNSQLQTVAAGQRPTPVDLAKVPGAVSVERAVLDLHTAAGKTIAVGSTNGRAAVWTTADGVAWTRAETKGLGTNSKQRLTKVTHGTQGWLAIGTEGGRPLIATSADGASWRRVDPSAFAPQNGRTVTLTGVTSGPKGHVIVGRDDSGTRASSALAWHSTDMGIWTPAKPAGLVFRANVSRAMANVTATPTGYVAVGSTSTRGAAAPANSRPGVWVSTDGLTWTEKAVTLPAKSAHLIHVAARGNLIVASGEGVMPQNRAITVVSTDGGNTWRGAALPFTADKGASYLRAQTVTSKGFTLVGSMGSWQNANTVQWTSADGQSWQPSTPEGEGLSGPGRQQILALAPQGDGLLGVGVTTEGKADQITLWRIAGG
ncbi:hypothetical protein [Spirillospora sp. NPDC047279]|uniref:hypothetical protein n=1 Tax=Spirillospora sp. NPDC047279 TaxID=3155478 RepID=UPI0034090606